MRDIFNRLLRRPRSLNTDGFERRRRCPAGTFFFEVATGDFLYREDMYGTTHSGLMALAGLKNGSYVENLQFCLERGLVRGYRHEDDGDNPDYLFLQARTKEDLLTVCRAVYSDFPFISVQYDITGDDYAKRYPRVYEGDCVLIRQIVMPGKSIVAHARDRAERERWQDPEREYH